MNLTTVLLDRSGSMERVRGQTIRRFNSWLAAQPRDGSRVTLVQFDTAWEVNYLAEPVWRVAPLTWSTYQPRGASALFDSVRRGVRETRSYVASHGWTEGVQVCLLTDGIDTASVSLALPTELARLGWDMSVWHMNGLHGDAEQADLAV